MVLNEPFQNLKLVTVIYKFFFQCMIIKTTKSSIFAKKKKNFIKVVKGLSQGGRQGTVWDLLVARDSPGQFMHSTLFLLIHRIAIPVPILKAQRLALRFGSSTHYVAEITIEPRPTWLHPVLTLWLSAECVSLCQKHGKPCFVNYVTWLFCIQLVALINFFILCSAFFV